ncbi:MAG: sigma-70 family RNA polymerase sigma factor, partial [Planctomycetes bacterium]|nr:sigma-70 family RNA polymerase sigma factor [Planctomycetota bacterium]
MDDKTEKVTQMITQTGDGQAERLAKDLLPLVYDELRDLAQKYLRGERKNHTLQPTALVHEAFMRLVDQSRVNWQGRTHFFAVGAQAMRRILIDHARARGRGKRGGDWQRVILSGLENEESKDDVDSITLHDALETLASLDAQQAQIVELRFFGGLTVEEVAKVMRVSKRKIEGDW